MTRTTTTFTATLTAAVVALGLSLSAHAGAPSLSSGPAFTAKLGAKLAAEPRGARVLKSALNAQKRRFNAKASKVRKLSSRSRDLLRHRGDVARHARLRGKVKATLAAKAKPRVQFKPKASKVTFRVNKPLTAVGSRFKTKTRGKGGLSGAQARKLNAAKKATSPKYRAYKANQKALAKAAKGRRVAKTAKTARTAAKAAKTAKTLKTARTLGKLASGGAATLVVGAALGVKVPDVVDVASWTATTLKNPKDAPKRFAALGKNTLKTAGQAARTLTKPKKIARNLGKAAKSVGCGVSSLFGKKCR